MAARPDPTSESHAATPPRAGLAAGAAALIALLTLAGLVFVARHGYYGMNVATGQVAALADAIRHGDPAPPSPAAEETPMFRTTVYFPAYPAMIAGLQSAGIAWRDALRAGSVLGGVLLLVAVAFGTWRLGGSSAGVLLAVALLATQFPFKLAAVAGRADLLAAACSAAAFVAWLRDEDLHGWWAPLFAGLAVLIKATAITVPAAIVLWALAARRPGAIVGFGLRAAGVVAAGVVLSIPFDGPARYLDAARTILFVPFNTSHALRGPAELLRYLASGAEWLVAFGIAVVAVLAVGRARRPAFWWMVTAGLLAVVVMGNRGADHNHMLELMAIACMLAGAWAAPRARPTSTLACALIVLAVFAASWRDAYTMGRRAMSPVERRTEVTAAVTGAAGEVFVEDPLIAIAAGRRSPISDPGALRAMQLRGDPAAAAVERSLGEGRYELLVLNANVERERDHWYRDFHVGEGIAAAILDAYDDAGEADGFTLYRRRVP